MEGSVNSMAFIRKRGQSYYLVHNVREDGRVRQIHLACLGRHPRISDEVVEGVTSKHPFVRVNWKELKTKASRDLVQPIDNDSKYLQGLLSSVRNLHYDLADLPLPLIEMTKDRELSTRFVSGLKLLRSTLEVKLNQLRKVKTLPFRA
jgi:hypothetical protein